jgi:hypothetical protein
MNSEQINVKPAAGQTLFVRLSRRFIRSHRVHPASTMGGVYGLQT